MLRNGLHRRFSAQYSVAMLEQRCNHSKQCRNNAVMLCCAKNRCCESSRVTSPLESCLQQTQTSVLPCDRIFVNLSFTVHYIYTKKEKFHAISFFLKFKLKLEHVCVSGYKTNNGLFFFVCFFVLVGLFFKYSSVCI